MQTCRTCKQSKPITEYYSDKSTKRGIRNVCKRCILDGRSPESYKKWKELYNNTERHRLKTRMAFFRKEDIYFTVQDIEKLLEQCDYKCTICKTDISKSYDIDHCHTAKMIRGLLCHGCNTGLGMFKDNIEALKSAVKYLEDANERIENNINIVSGDREENKWATTKVIVSKDGIDAMYNSVKSAAEFIGTSGNSVSCAARTNTKVKGYKVKYNI